MIRSNVYLDFSDQIYKAKLDEMPSWYHFCHMTNLYSILLYGLFTTPNRT